MAKRQAAYQIGKDDTGDYDEEEETSTPASNPEEIARRPVKGLPKRSGRAAPSAPPKSSDNTASTFAASIPSFGAPAFPSSLPFSSPAPPSLPSFSFAPPTSSVKASTSAPSFPSFQPPSSLPKLSHPTEVVSTSNGKDDQLQTYYTSLRGLNHSLIEALQKELSNDPFVNLAGALTTALSNYTRHWKDIDSKLDVAKPPSLPSPAGNFSFGGKPVSVESNTASKPSLPSLPTLSAGAFSFGGKPVSSFTSSTTSSSTTTTLPAFTPPTTITNPSEPLSGSKEDNAKDALLSLAGTSTDTTMGGESSSLSGSKYGAFGPRPAHLPPKIAAAGPPPGKGDSSATSSDSAQEDASKEPKSSFNFKFGTSASPWGNSTASSTTPTFGFGSSSPASNASASGTGGSIGNPVGFAFGTASSEPKGKEEKLQDANPSPFGAASAFGSATTSGAKTTSAFGGSTFGLAGGAFGASSSSQDDKSKSEAKETKSTSAFGAGSSVFGSGGVFGSAFTNSASSDDKDKSKSAFGTGSSAFGTSTFGSAASTFNTTNSLGSGSAFGKTSAFGTSSSSAFGGFGAGSGFGLTAPAPKASTSTTSAEESKLDSQGGGDETPAAFEFTSTDIEGAGEENELSVFTVRGKLLQSVDGAWKPLGLGNFKVKKHNETGKQRVLFRTEGNGNVIANFNIFPDMKISKQAKSLLFPGVLESKLVSLALQVKLPTSVDEAYDALTKASEEAKS